MHYALWFDGSDVTDLSVEVGASVLLCGEVYCSILASLLRPDDNM